MRRIALEEHFWTREYYDYLRSRKDFPKIMTIEDEKNRRTEQTCLTPMACSFRDPDLTNRLIDLGEGRVQSMDKAGIDMQVLSLATPGTDALSPSEGTFWARKINEDLAGAIKKYPQRLAGFATLAPQDPVSAARELERTIEDSGFCGR